MDDSIMVTCPQCSTKVVYGGLDFAQFSDSAMAGTVKSCMKKITQLEAENSELKKGISDLQAYNGDQEEMSNIFARLKKLEQSNNQGEQRWEARGNLLQWNGDES